jgi:hypothetical protein
MASRLVSEVQLLELTNGLDIEGEDKKRLKNDSWILFFEQLHRSLHPA